MHFPPDKPEYSATVKPPPEAFQRSADYASEAQLFDAETQKIHLRPGGDVFLSPAAGQFEITLEEDGSVLKMRLRRDDPMYLLTGISEKVFVFSSRMIKTEYYRIVSSATELFIAVNHRPFVRIRGSAAAFMHQLGCVRFEQQYATRLTYSGQSTIGIGRFSRLSTLCTSTKDGWFRLQVADFALIAKRRSEAPDKQPKLY